MSACWNPRLYGTAADPVRQSHLDRLAGRFCCSRRFQFEREEEAAGGAGPRERVYGETIVGTAVHETIKRYLTACPDRTLERRLPSNDRFAEVVREELDQAAGGLPIDWGKVRPDDAVRDAVAMVRGALLTLADRASAILLIEAPFLAQIDCGAKEPYWLKGTIDIVYRARDEGLGLADWKTGKQRPHPIALDHGYQLGIYAHALEHGVFWPGEERQVEIGAFPQHIHLVHLRDFLPYQRRTRKRIKTADEAAFYGAEVGQTINCETGAPRGTGWYAARRSPADVARLKHSLRTIAGSVRLGRFLEHLGESCAKCPFKGPCLNDGWSVDGAEKRQLDAALRGVDLDGLDDGLAA